MKIHKTMAHNAVGTFASPDYTLQEAEENQSTLIKRCRGGGVWVRVVYPFSHIRARAHACSSPSPTHHAGKKIPLRGVRSRSHIKEKRGASKEVPHIWSDWRAVLWRPGDQWALTHCTREKDLLLREKVLKSALKVCSRCEMPHSLFYWPLLRTCENPNDSKHETEILWPNGGSRTLGNPSDAQIFTF